MHYAGLFLGKGKRGREREREQVLRPGT